MMLKATIAELKPRLRCVRFDSQESPASVNGGKGWTELAQVEFMQSMELREIQQHSSNLCTIRRVGEPSRAKQTSRDITKGVQLWLDK
jgi:hypothetical protein